MEQATVLRLPRLLTFFALTFYVLSPANADVLVQGKERKPVSASIVLDASKNTSLTLGVGVATEHQAALLKNNLRTGKTKVVTCLTPSNYLTRSDYPHFTNCIPVQNYPAGETSKISQVINTPSVQDLANSKQESSPKSTPEQQLTSFSHHDTEEDYVPAPGESDASTVEEGEFSVDDLDYDVAIVEPVIFEEVTDNLGNPYKFIVNNDEAYRLPGVRLTVDQAYVLELREHGYAFPDTGRDFDYGLYGYDDFGVLSEDEEIFQTIQEETFARSSAYLAKQLAKFLPDGMVDKSVLNYVTNYRTTDVIDKYMNDLLPKINDYYWKVLDQRFVYEKLDWRKGEGANLDSLPVRAVYGYVPGWKQGAYQTFYQQATELYLDGSVTQSYDTYYAIVYGDGHVLPNNPQDKATWDYFFQDVQGAKQAIAKAAPRYAHILATGRVLTFNNLGLVIDAFSYAGRDQVKSTLVVSYATIKPYLKPDVARKLGLVPLDTKLQIN